jgi:hypothetical protein
LRIEQDRSGRDFPMNAVLDDARNRRRGSVGQGRKEFAAARSPRLKGPVPPG